MQIFQSRNRKPEVFISKFQFRVGSYFSETQQTAPGSDAYLKSTEKIFLKTKKVINSLCSNFEVRCCYSLYYFKVEIRDSSFSGNFDVVIQFATKEFIITGTSKVQFHIASKGYSFYISNVCLLRLTFDRAIQTTKHDI